LALADETRRQGEGDDPMSQRRADEEHATTAIIMRVASPDDGPELQDIERLAGERFRDVGMPEIADDEPASLEALAGYARAGRSWVALGRAGTPIGYVLADVVDGHAHIEQVSVRPDHQGAGVGRALIDQVRTWALASGMEALTLTTFGNVPWNAPLYEHLGFRVLADREVGPELRALRDAETAHGLEPVSRVCMRLDLLGDGAPR
jgi:GNAT superfamily N-acetyltransferase